MPAMAEKRPSFGTGGQRQAPNGTRHLLGTEQCPESLCSRHPGRLHRFMVLHNPRTSERGFSVFFAIKEALLNVTKTMNPHTEQQLNT